MSTLQDTPTGQAPPPVLECPPWCAGGHGADVKGPGKWIRNHTRTPRYIDLTGYPDAFAMVWVATHDTWRPDKLGWRRDDRPSVLISPARDTEAIKIWNVPTLRPILKAAPLLMPGLLDLILEAVQFCEIKIPQEYAR